MILTLGALITVGQGCDPFMGVRWWNFSVSASGGSYNHRHYQVLIRAGGVVMAQLLAAQEPL